MLDSLTKLWTPLDEDQCLRRLRQSFPAATCGPSGDPVRREMPRDTLLGWQADDGLRLFYRSGWLLRWSVRVQMTPSESGTLVELGWSPWRAKPRPAPTVKTGCLIALLVQLAVMVPVGIVVAGVFFTASRPHRPNVMPTFLLLLVNAAVLMNAVRQMTVRTYVARLFRHTVSVALQARPVESRSAVPATAHEAAAPSS